MTAVFVDSNVLLDVIAGDAVWREWSGAALARIARRHRMVINPIVYAEVSVRFRNIEDVDLTLPKKMFDHEAIPFEAAFLAGKVHAAYRARGGSRHATLPDFFIGAHATVAGYDLLTRDVARYRGYFPRLHLIAPE